MKVLYLVTAGLQVVAALFSFPHNWMIGVLNIVAAVSSVTLWVLARKRESASSESGPASTSR